MPKPTDWDHHSSVTKNYSFVWNSELSEDRMWAISDWIGTLADEQRKMLDEILRDAREAGGW